MVGGCGLSSASQGSWRAQLGLWAGPLLVIRDVATPENSGPCVWFDAGAEVAITFNPWMSPCYLTTWEPGQMDRDWWWWNSAGPGFSICLGEGNEVVVPQIQVEVKQLIVNIYGKGLFVTVIIHQKSLKAVIPNHSGGATRPWLTPQVNTWF